MSSAGLRPTPPEGDRPARRPCWAIQDRYGAGRLRRPCHAHRGKSDSHQSTHEVQVRLCDSFRRTAQTLDDYRQEPQQQVTVAGSSPVSRRRLPAQVQTRPARSKGSAGRAHRRRGCATLSEGSGPTAASDLSVPRAVTSSGRSTDAGFSRGRSPPLCAPGLSRCNIQRWNETAPAPPQALLTSCRQSVVAVSVGPCAL